MTIFKIPLTPEAQKFNITLAGKEYVFSLKFNSAPTLPIVVTPTPKMVVLLGLRTTQNNACSTGEIILDPQMPINILSDVNFRYDSCSPVSFLENTIIISGGSISAYLFSVKKQNRFDISMMKFLFQSFSGDDGKTVSINVAGQDPVTFDPIDYGTVVSPALNSTTRYNEATLTTLLPIPIKDDYTITFTISAALISGLYLRAIIIS
jgi:hypothetical protein